MGPTSSSDKPGQGQRGSGRLRFARTSGLLANEQKLLRSASDIEEMSVTEKRLARRAELRAADNWDDSDRKKDRPPSRRKRAIQQPAANAAAPEASPGAFLQLT